MSPIRVAVVGLGYWGPNLARNIRELECAELAAVCDADHDRLESAARRFSEAEAHRPVRERARQTTRSRPL